MYDVEVRDLPDRRVLSLLRHLHAKAAGVMRQVLVWPRTVPGYGPECDFAVPLVPGEVH